MVSLVGLLVALSVRPAAGGEAPAEDLDAAPPGSAAAATGIGAGLVAGGMVVAGLPDRTGEPLYRSHPVRIALTANLLAVGIPTLVTGSAQLGVGYREVGNPAHLETWRRASAAKVLHLPYLISGMVMNIAWLSIVLHNPGATFIGEERTFLLPIAGVASMATGLGLAATGDAAAAELWGSDGGWDDAPGRLLLKSGVALWATGAAGMIIGGALLMPLEASFGGDGSMGGRVMLTAAPFLAAGVPMTLAGAARVNRAGGVAARGRPGRGPTLIGFAPLGEPDVRGLSATWIF